MKWTQSLENTTYQNWYKMIRKSEQSNMHSRLNSRFKAFWSILRSTAWVVLLKYLVKLLTPTFQNLQEHSPCLVFIWLFYHSLAHSWKLIMLPSFRYVNLVIASHTFFLIFFTINAIPSLAKSHLFVKVHLSPISPRSFLGYSEPSGSPFQEFLSTTTSLTLSFREATVILYISLTLPTKL